MFQKMFEPKLVKRHDIYAIISINSRDFDQIKFINNLLKIFGRIAKLADAERVVVCKTSQGNVRRAYSGDRSDNAEDSHEIYQQICRRFAASNIPVKLISDCTISDSLSLQGEMLLQMNSLRCKNP